jgi:uncharacterized protein with NAD-binding domain and iron-sulfur cluster
MKQKVIILGGGVAGLSAAHELAERGFQVEVLERRAVAGGKARSLAVLDAPEQSLRSAGRLPLAGEHGFRFFPGFYRHVVDTMARIPCGACSVADNLVDTTQIQIASYGRPSVFVPARFPQGPADLQTALLFLLNMLGGGLDVSPLETAFLASKVWQMFTSCEERRMTEYEKISWYDFIDAANRSPAYQSLYGHGITRSLVAAKARRASTKTIGNIFLQMLLHIVQPGNAADRVLNGPTSDVWIDPWRKYLTSLGVVYRTDAEVVSINLSRGRVVSVTVVRDGAAHDISGDYFVAALPIERMAALVTPALAAADPALAALPGLSSSVEWMNGIQFYLTEDVPLVHGHTIFLNSPWALTSVSQAQFWSDYQMASHGDGKVRGILSVDISNWQTPGFNGKKAVECTRDEIKEEVWNQVKLGVNVGGRTMLTDQHLHSWFLDPDIMDTDPTAPGSETNLEPLLVNYVDTWRSRPEATTRVGNLFLASDYVRTHTDLATMEAANEAARRATNGVLAASGSSAKACAVWPLREPESLAPLKAYDRQRFRSGLTWGGPIGQIAQTALSLAADSAGPRGSSTDTPASQARSAASARAAAAAASDEGLAPDRLAELARQLHGDVPGLAAVSAAPELWSAGAPNVPQARPTTSRVEPRPYAPDGAAGPRVRIIGE